MIRRSILKGFGAAAILSLGILASPAMAQDTTIRVASVTGPSHHHNVSLRWFADQVAARDVGLTIEVLDGLHYVAAGLVRHLEDPSAASDVCTPSRGCN